MRLGKESGLGQIVQLYTLPINMVSLFTGSRELGWSTLLGIKFQQLHQNNVDLKKGNWKKPVMYTLNKWESEQLLIKRIVDSLKL